MPSQRPAKRSPNRDGCQPRKKTNKGNKISKRSKAAKRDNSKGDEAYSPSEGKPRLTTPDLEFDYDRSQLRDPRPTPGRVKRPRMSSSGVTEEFKQKFYIPKPEKPKGRLNACQKEELFRETAFLDPSETFHNLYVCHRKGRDGSPTYDEGGFEMDWEKVDQWMKPKSYNKRSMINSMGRALDRGKSEREQMYEIFFTDGKAPDVWGDVDSYMKDQVSKDLGIPWRQIGVPELRQWEEKGFQKQDYEKWWHEPTAEERKRMMNMLSGASLRKDL